MRERKDHQLRVDWPACQARGLCFELLPEVVELDDWGYPVVGGTITPELLSAARAAVRGCPRMALRLLPASPGRRPRSGADRP